MISFCIKVILSRIINAKTLISEDKKAESEWPRESISLSTTLPTLRKNVIPTADFKINDTVGFNYYPNPVDRVYREEKGASKECRLLLYS